MFNECLCGSQAILTRATLSSLGTTRELGPEPVKHAPILTATGLLVVMNLGKNSNFSRVCEI